MYGNEEFIQSETDYRTARVRLAWGPQRRKDAARRTRRRQATLRGAAEMR